MSFGAKRYLIDSSVPAHAKAKNVYDVANVAAIEWVKEFEVADWLTFSKNLPQHIVSCSLFCEHFAREAATSGKPIRESLSKLNGVDLALASEAKFILQWFKNYVKLTSQDSRITQAIKQKFDLARDYSKKESQEEKESAKVRHESILLGLEHEKQKKTLRLAEQEFDMQTKKRKFQTQSELAEQRNRMMNNNLIGTGDQNHPEGQLSPDGHGEGERRGDTGGSGEND